ncbi:MAG: ABC transporter permease [Actinobacteria bacterium]|nr:ABC transporter permease [Actinomycetota bacterium]
MSGFAEDGGKGLSTQLMPGAPIPVESDAAVRQLREDGTLRRSWRRWRSPLLHVAVVLVLLGIWQLVYMLEIWSPVFVPSPAAVWNAAVTASTTHDGTVGYSGVYLYEHLWASLQRILIASAVAILAGVPLGLLLGTSKWSRVILEPGVTFIRALPPLAYFSLLVIWFGIDETPKVILLVLAALPPIVLATSDAVRSVSHDRLLALRTLGASRMQVVRHGVFPSVLPEIMTGIRVAVLFAFTTMVAAETINGLPGIGGLVRDAQRFNQTDIVMMGIILIGICGIALDLLVQLLDRLLVPWRAEL